jgi:predicted transcriptional regulator
MNRKLSLIPIVVLVFTFVSCGKKSLENQNMALQSELDSLSIILSETETAVESLSEIGIILDSIEFQRDIIRIEMMEGGIAYDDYVKRVEALNGYLEQAENRITKLEGSQRSYSSLLKKLRAELDEKNRHVDALEIVLNDFKADNVSMQGSIRLQEAEIEDMEWEIQLREQELALLDAKIEQMIEVSKISEADGYYARAVAYEEAANRTKLAPRKKKETLKQALELYQHAVEFGHDTAQAKVDELSEKVN